MSEEVIFYGERQSGFWTRKWRGLNNYYFKYKRYFLWWLHRNIYQIEPDHSKLPDDAIPVIINNFNRLDPLKKQIDWLLNLEDKVAIIIADNRSSYPPLLEFYDQLDHPLVQVVFLGFNTWRKGAEYLGEQKLKGFEKYIITDPDLLPYPDTPADLISHLARLLDQYPAYNHVGTSLEINDLPDKNPLKNKVIHFEKNYWPPQVPCLNEEVYPAPIDTTFAMYRRNSKVLKTQPALRTVRPYCLQHLDWYVGPQDFTPEYIFYLKSCKKFATWATQLKADQKKQTAAASPAIDPGSAQTKEWSAHDRVKG